jgi:hypothetical protein
MVVTTDHDHQLQLTRQYYRGSDSNQSINTVVRASSASTLVPKLHSLKTRLPEPQRIRVATRVMYTVGRIVQLARISPQMMELNTKGSK